MIDKLILSFFMLFVCTTQGCINDDEPKGPSLQVGDSLPQFSVIMNTGETISTESLRGKVPVIVFFNTNCSDCREELPVINQLWEIYMDDEMVEVVPVAREESDEEILEYWNANNLSMPFSPQENREVYSLFAPSVIPRIYIANPQGIITFTSDDSDMPSLNTLREQISALLP